MDPILAHAPARAVAHAADGGAAAAPSRKPSAGESGPHGTLGTTTRAVVHAAELA